MNRENKKRKYDKKYYKTHPCTDSFTCKICGWPVVSAGAGSNHRNHCPNCLHSIHLDNEPGDRESRCHGRMEPIGVWVRKEAHGTGHASLWKFRDFQSRCPGNDCYYGINASGPFPGRNWGRA